MVTQEEFREWQQHPVTKKVWQTFKEDLENLKNAWLSQQFVEEKDNSYAIGQGYALIKILDISHEQIENLEQEEGVSQNEESY